MSDRVAGAPTLEERSSWCVSALIRGVRVEHGRYFAQPIPGAAYAELDGDEHILTATRVPEFLAHVMPFLREVATRDVPEPDKVLATILFPTSSARRHGRPNSATCNGENCWPSTMGGFAGSWPGFARGARYSR